MKQQGAGYLFYRLVLTIVVQILFVQNAFAYLDPGTGSYIFQVMVAAVIGGLFAIKMYWRKIKAFVINLFSKKRESDPGD